MNPQSKTKELITQRGFRTNAQKRKQIVFYNLSEPRLATNSPIHFSIGLIPEVDRKHVQEQKAARENPEVFVLP